MILRGPSAPALVKKLEFSSEASEISVNGEFWTGQGLTPNDHGGEGQIFQVRWLILHIGLMGPQDAQFSQLGMSARGFLEEVSIRLGRPGKEEVSSPVWTGLIQCMGSRNRQKIRRKGKFALCLIVELGDGSSWAFGRPCSRFSESSNLDKNHSTGLPGPPAAGELLVGNSQSP